MSTTTKYLFHEKRHYMWDVLFKANYKLEMAMCFVQA